MDKLINMIKEELKNVEKQGFNANNLETTFKLVDIEKDLYKIQKLEDERYRNKYMELKKDKNEFKNYDISHYMKGKLQYIMESLEEYECNKEKYGHEKENEEICDSLDRLMYFICLFIKCIKEDVYSEKGKHIIESHLKKTIE